MTKEERQLLLKDLCARLPYGVYVRINETHCLDKNEAITEGFIGGYCKPNMCQDYSLDEIDEFLDDGDDVKLYLRPMSSMTEEELNECVCQSGIKDIECPNWQDIPKEKQFEARLNYAIAVFLTDSNNIDWLLAHHFDFRGLIEKGLALKAKEGMYKTE